MRNYKTLVKRTPVARIELMGDFERDLKALSSSKIKIEGLPDYMFGYHDWRAMLEKDHEPRICFSNGKYTFSHSLKHGVITIWSEEFYVRQDSSKTNGLC